MYLPKHFEVTDPATLHAVVHACPLATWATVVDGLPLVNHVPFHLDPTRGEHGTLIGHVARANPVWRNPAPSVLVFQGSDAYISPNWYPSKHEAHRQVPTWNYEAVHAHGTLTVHDDERFVRGMVGRLTRRHEAGEPRPWKMADSEPAFIDGLLRNIVGIEVNITALVGKRKLSQNKDERDRLNAADTLEVRGQGDLARSMRQQG